MAYEKGTWQFDGNRNSPAPASVLAMSRWTLWYLKAVLTGQIGGFTQGLWTVVGSSDGTTGAMDGVDRWTSVFDGTKIVRGATSGTARSWMLLRAPASMPSGQLYLLIDFLGTQDYYARIHWFLAAPTGGTSAAVAPTATDLWGCGGQTVQGNLTLNNNTIAAHRYFVGMTTTGEFYLVGARAGTAKHQLFISAMCPTPRKIADYAQFFTCAFYEEATGATANTAINSTNGAVSASGPLFATASVGASSVGARSPNNAGSGTYCAALATVGVQTNTAGVSSAMAGGAYAATALDIIDGCAMDVPVYVLLTDNAQIVRGARGRLQDVAAVPIAAVPNGSVVRDGSNNVEFATFHSLLLPANYIPDLT